MAGFLHELILGSAYRTLAAPTLRHAGEELH